MIQRFASACLVGCVAIAIAVTLAFATQLVSSQRFYLVLAIWCAAPCIWGLWAMLAPATWVPQRLPLWGAFLGIIAGTLAAFVLNMPARVLGLNLSVAARGAALLVMVAFYYCLWMIVRAAYRHLSAARTMAAIR
jgi:hypothetical protein